MISQSMLYAQLNKKLEEKCFERKIEFTDKQHLLSGFRKVDNITGPLHFAATKGLGEVKCFANVKEMYPNGNFFGYSDLVHPSRNLGP